MWKDSYATGIETVDAQHKALFKMVDSFIVLVDDKDLYEANKDACIKAVAFMKSYVVEHFRDEELYMGKINYAGLTEHVKLHKKLIRDVEDYALLLSSSNYRISLARRFAGMLTAWLIHHVADSDQRYAGNYKEHAQSTSTTPCSLFMDGMGYTLEQMVGIQASGISTQIKNAHSADGDIFVSIDIVGDLTGNAVFSFSKEFALGAMLGMTMMEFNEIDDMVCSAISEISNIVSGQATIALNAQGFNCDISTPTLTLTPPEKLNSSKEVSVATTPIGSLSISASVSKK